MILRLLFLSVLTVSSQGQEFRYDYEFNRQAGGWLKFHVIPSIWREARLRCAAEGAVLASPLNKQMKAAMVSFVSKFKGNAPVTIFTGIHSLFSKGDYSSVEGVPLGRLPITWAAGEPDNLDNAESCLAMRTDNAGSMSDVRCEDVHPYICFKKETHLTMTECGTTDPAYSLDPRTGSCYKIHKNSQTWDQAYRTCVGEGGHLAVINSDLEATVVVEIFQRHPDSTIRSTDPGNLAIGIHDWGEHGTFNTIHGQSLDEAGFHKWYDNNPDNSTKQRTNDKGEFCGSFLRRASFNDVWCNVPVPFMCEKKRDSLI